MTVSSFVLHRHALTNKEISELTGVGQNTVKAIDKRRLERLYVEDGKLRRPESPARFLGIDEFKLHNGHKYATHIIDMKTGHILWISEGKKKQVVYDFIEHVGLEWMSHVEAVALDMNSDFQEAFLEKCPHLRVVFDYFHIFKNFNDKVVSEIRKDEQKHLEDAGDYEAARSLKRSRHILMSSRATLERKDREASEGKALRRESSIFSVTEVKRRNIGYMKRYESILEKKSAAVRDGSHQGDAARGIFMPVGAPYDGIHQSHHGSLSGACARRGRTELASDVVPENPRHAS